MTKIRNIIFKRQSTVIKMFAEQISEKDLDPKYIKNGQQ